MKIKIGLLTLASLILIAGCSNAATPSPTQITPPSPNTDTTNPQPVEKTKATVETKEIKETDPNGPITVKYPYTTNEKINKPIKAFIDQVISDFKKDAMPVDPETGAGPNALDVAYSTISFNDDIVTFKYDLYINTGGAHPNSYIFTQTFDLSNGTQYTNKDILGSQDSLTKISSDAIAMLKKNIEKSLNEATETTQPLDEATLNWITNGAAPDWANYQAIAILPNELIIYFNPYQVAPYAAGPQEVHLKMNQVKSTLPAPFGTAAESTTPPPAVPPISPLNPLPPLEGKKIACNTDADCVPDPTQCHPHTCMTTTEAEGKTKPEMCTMMFDTQAAYSAADCTCDLGICKNKNIPESLTEPDTTLPQ